MLRLTGATVRYGDVTALDRVDLEVADGERLTLLGPSGSGKTTLLRAVAGLEPLSSGTIAWDGHDLAGVPPHARGFGLMFQEYVLFPHHDVAGNVAFGLRMRGDPSREIARRVDEVLALVGLAGYGARRINELSGGEQQRIALARALAPEPRLLMLDEPLGALDRALRSRLTDELAALFAELRLTILYVTHDQEEALALGDRVAVMRAGGLEAIDRPEALWRHPPTEFVAEFLGMANVCTARVVDGTAVTPWGPVALPEGVPDGEHRLLLRPEAFRRVPSGPICGTVAARAFRGDRVHLRVGVDGAPDLIIHADWPETPGVGDQVCVDVAPPGVVVLGEPRR
jgi:thiamine transport system ATP-binding protein